MPVELIGIEEHFSAGIQVSREEGPAKGRLLIVLEKIENGRLVAALQNAHIFENSIEKGK